MVMDQNLENCDLGAASNVTMKATVRGIKSGQRERSNKCNQCNYTSSDAGNLRRHSKMHSGEKPNKCKQCNSAFPRADHLIRHLETHRGKKLNKCNQCDYASFLQAICNQCDFASSQASSLKVHLKTQWRKVKQMQPV